MIKINLFVFFVFCINYSFPQLSEPDKYYKLGLENLRKEQWTHAVENFSKSIGEESRAYSYLNRGFAHFNLNNYELAMKDYGKAIELDPIFYEAYFKRAVLKERLKDIRGAIDDYSVAISIDPGSYSANLYHRRGSLKPSIGDIDGALKDISKAIDYNPGLAEAYMDRGMINIIFKKDFESGCKDLTTAGEQGLFSVYELIKKHCN